MVCGLWKSMIKVSINFEIKQIWNYTFCLFFLQRSEIIKEKKKFKIFTLLKKHASFIPLLMKAFSPYFCYCFSIRLTNIQYYHYLLNEYNEKKNS